MMMITVLFRAFTVIVAARVITVQMKLGPVGSKAENRARVGQLIYQMMTGTAFAVIILGAGIVYRIPEQFPTWLSTAPFIILALVFWIAGFILRFLFSGS